jgi:hypothetical protein
MEQDEIIFDHLGSKEKTQSLVEGSTHNFTPCRPEYGDTVKRAFTVGYRSQAAKVSIRFGSRNVYRFGMDFQAQK